MTPRTIFSTRKRAIDPNCIIETVANYYQIPLSVFKAKGRKRVVTQARMIAMYLIKKRSDTTYKLIGELFEGDTLGRPKDHTSIIHACNTVLDLMDTDINVKKDVYYLNSII